MKSIESRTQQVFHLFLGTGSLQAANIITFILLARWLGVDQYGQYRQLFLIHQISAAIFFSAFPTALLYFCGRQTPEGRNAVVRRQLGMVLVIGLVLSLLLRYGNKLLASCLNSPGMVELLPWFACYPAAYMVYSLVSPALVSYGYTNLSAVFSFFLACLNSIPVLLMARQGLELKWIVMTATGAAWVGAFAAIALLLILTRDPRRDIPPPPLFEMAAYMGPLLLASGISLVGLRMDHLLVSHELGPAVYGIYAVGALEIPLFSLLNSSVTSVLMPQFSRLAKDHNWEDIRRIWQRALMRSATIVFPVAAALIVLADPLILTLFGERYEDAVPIFRVYLLLAPFRIMTFGLVLRAGGQTRQDLQGAILYLSVVTVLAYTGLKIFGAVGAIGGVVLATILLAGFLSFKTGRMTAGALRPLDLYPLRILAAFPCVVSANWLLMRALKEFGFPGAFTQFALGVAVTALMISAGTSWARRSKWY